MNDTNERQLDDEAELNNSDDQGVVILDGLAAPPLPPLVVPDGHVKVRRVGTACYIPGDGVTVRTGEVWHLPADEADEVCAPDHPFGLWEKVAGDIGAEEPVAQQSDDPGSLSEDEHPANNEEQPEGDNAADTESESEAKAEEVDATTPAPRRMRPEGMPRRYVMPDASSVRSAVDPSANVAQNDVDEPEHTEPV